MAEVVNQRERYSLQRPAGDFTLAIPVSNRLVGYEEKYRLTPQLYALLLRDEAAAAVFAEACRRREHDDLLVLAPGRDRGTDG